MSDRTNHGSLASRSELDARLKRIDEPRWLASRYAPSHQRPALVVLFLVYNELARVRFASEPMLGQIRLQWWREAIAELRAGKPPRRQDLVSALDEMFPSSSPSLAAIEMLIDAFDASLDGEERPDIPPAPKLSGPGAVMAEAAGRLLNPAIVPGQLNILKRAGTLDDRGASHLAPTKNDLAILRSHLRSLEPALWPAVAHLAAYNSHGVQVDQLQARWRVLWAILTRTI